MSNDRSTEDRNSEQVPAWQPVQIQRPTQVSSSAGLTEEETSRVIDEFRAKIYPRSVTGIFARWRIILVLFTQVIFYGLPWLQWNDRQAVLFDLAARKFYIFGMVLWPQDVFYMAVILIISAYGLFLFTALAGRLFCGYACPQTVYTEIFMWIERKVEGDRVARIRLDEEPWSFRKFRIKATKHILWIAVAWWTGSTFIGYFAPIRELGSDLINFELGPWQWFWIIFYSVATWGNAGFLREAVCKYMCPYARFQSVMVDSDTFVVTYDKIRGEPRGGRSRKVDHHEMGLGDCIDCTVCVQVCPTGIDIRNGLQYMCIGCGACIDACDQIMDKMNYPKGLIRYTSENGMLEGLDNKQARKRLFKPRVYVYLTLLAFFIIAFLVSVAMRTPLRMDIMRDRGALGREVPGGLIENVYRIQLINMTEEPLDLEITAQGKDLENVHVRAGDSDSAVVKVAPFANEWVPLVIQVPLGEVKPGLYDLQLKAQTLESEELDLKAEEKTSFFVPN